jgi:replication-associated recombination protein RarA
MGSPMPPTRRGYQPHECVSAMQKAIRRSQVHEALYWSVELARSGYVNWMWKRVFEIMTEDIGPADRYLPATIHALHDFHQRDKNHGSATMFSCQAIILLATAKKSGLSCWSVLEHNSDHMPRLEIPDEALDQHTRKGRSMGRGIEHFADEGALKIDLEDPEKTMKELEERYFKMWRRSHVEKDLEPVNPFRERQRTPDGVGVRRVDPGQMSMKED